MTFGTSRASEEGAHSPHGPNGLTTDSVTIGAALAVHATLVCEAADREGSAEEVLGAAVAHGPVLVDAGLKRNDAHLVARGMEVRIITNKQANKQ
eukprot:1195728-Prorocentrum_minimum.AAC.4